MISIVCEHISSDFFPVWLTAFWPVAFFFVVAGFFLKEETLLRPVGFIRHKFMTIYLPGTIIYVLAVLLHNVFVRNGCYPLGAEHPMTHEAFAMWDTKTCIIKTLKTVVAPNGELVMGAMWFLYALFFSLCFLSLSAVVAKRVSKEKLTTNSVLWLILVLTATLSIWLSTHGIKIPRISNAVTIMIFIQCGMLMRQKLKWNYDSWCCGIIALVIYAQRIILPHGYMSFAVGLYPDLILPLASSVAATYFVLFISKKIERLKNVTTVLTYIGRKSLYIMALHIAGFFLCTKLIDIMGLGTDLNMSAMLYTYRTGANALLAAMYLLFGIGVPLLIMFIYDKAKALIIQYTHN